MLRPQRVLPLAAALEIWHRKMLTKCVTSSVRICMLPCQELPGKHRGEIGSDEEDDQQMLYCLGDACSRYTCSNAYPVFPAAEMARFSRLSPSARTHANRRWDARLRCNRRLANTVLDVLMENTQIFRTGT